MGDKTMNNNNVVNLFNSNVSTPVAKEYTINAYTQTAHERVTDKYVHVDSTRVYEKLKTMGFTVVSSNSALRGKSKEHGRHITMFEHPTLQVGDSMLRVIVDNSHDGSRSVTIRVGLFRMACANGLVIGSDVIKPYRIRHIGNVEQRIEKIDDYIAASMATIQTMQDRMNSILLNTDQTVELYRQAWVLRFGSDEGFSPWFFNSKRTQDDGNSTWVIYNRIQETLMQGGLKKRSRAIKSATRDVDFNNDLFNLVADSVKLVA